MDIVKFLKWEKKNGTVSNRRFPEEVDSTNDYVGVKGVSFEGDGTKTLDLDVNGDIQFKDTTNPSGRTLKNITDDIDSKYPAGNPNSFETPAQLNARDTANRSRANHTGNQPASTISDFNSASDARVDIHGNRTDNPHAVTKAQVGLGSVDNTSDANKPVSTAQQTALDLKYNASNPNSYETPTQLNTRDSNNRNRTNHTGTQLAATISNFAATVLSSVLTGISFATGTAIVSTDSILVAFGKAQKQITDLGANKYDASNPNGYETPAQLTSRDTANRARANHTGTQLSSTISDFNSASDARVALHGNLINNPHAVTKSQVGLGNVDNTSDVNKPVSTAQQAALDLKYNASNPNAYETPAQLNTRDTNNRARANHTGTQLASTISNFATTVLSTVLTGLSLATSTPVVATDSLLIAIGKLQAQISLRALAAIQINAGTGLTGGGDLTANRTISMPNVGTAGTSGAANSYNSITRDAQGRVTAVTTNLISIISSQVSDFAATVRSTVLTGVSFATATVVVAADSVLVAIGKLQAQINAMVFGSQYQYFEDLTPFTTTSTALVQAAIFSASFVNGHEYRLNMQWNFTTNSTSQSAAFRVFVNGVAQGSPILVELKDVTDGITYQTFVKYTATSTGNLNIELRTSMEGSNSVTVSTVRCDLWRVL